MKSTDPIEIRTTTTSKSNNESMEFNADETRRTFRVRQHTIMSVKERRKSHVEFTDNNNQKTKTSKQDPHGRNIEMRGRI